MIFEDEVRCEGERAAAFAYGATETVISLNLIRKPAVNAAPIHSKQSRGFRDVAARLVQGTLNQQLLCSIQIQWNRLCTRTAFHISRALTSRNSLQKMDMALLDRPATAFDQSPLDEVLKLAHTPGESIRRE